MVMWIKFAHSILRRRQWHPTPILLPGKSPGWRSLVGCSRWVSKSRTRLSDFPFTFHFPALEKDMATHSSVLAWRIPGMVEPGRLPSVGSHRVGHDWSDAAAAAETLFKGCVKYNLRFLFLKKFYKSQYVKVNKGNSMFYITRSAKQRITKL